jgi:hypothetical protein
MPDEAFVFSFALPRLPEALNVVLEAKRQREGAWESSAAFASPRSSVTFAESNST